jgi:protein-L-isoaspartate(D-aspartate) O-methyltransferase
MCTGETKIERKQRNAYLIMGAQRAILVLAVYEGKMDEFAEQRRAMVEFQIKARGISDPLVLAAMAKVPRHLFIPEKNRFTAYDDHPVSIGEGQTISQPYMVASMTQALLLRGGEKVLEIGTGSGYSTAVLAEIVFANDPRKTGAVYSLERIESLSLNARAVVERLGYTRVKFFVGDGSVGLPEFAPFDAIVVTAGAPAVPVSLKQQLADGGRLVVPVGDRVFQQLVRVIRTGERWVEEALEGCTFVPLIGAEGW